MHYTTRVQIAQEKQLSGMMIATNALQIEAQIRNEEPPKTVTGMAHFLREIALSLPRYQRANTFPGSKPNCNEATTSGLRSGALAQRPLDAAIPATGAGHITRLREDGIRIPCNESLAQRAEKTQAPRAA